MKKPAGALLLVLVLVLSPLCPALAESLQPEDAVDLTSPCACLMEQSTGQVIYAKDADARHMPASVTKVMTLLLIAEAVDGGSLSLGDSVTASSAAASMGGSQIWLEEGETMSVDECIKCIAVVSANDCAVAMAEHIAGSEKAFVALMNARAAELGMENTAFTNCTGLFDDPLHYTTARDVALMSRELLSHRWITEYTTIWMDTVRGGEFGLTNTNKLVRFYEGCTGLKTGYTSAAGYCLSASALRDGTEYIAVIMGSDSIEHRNGDASSLLSYAFANYSLFRAGDGLALPPVRVVLGKSDSVQPVYEGSASLLLRKTQISGATCELDLADSLEAPVAAGDPIGLLTVRSGGDVLAEVPVTAGEEVARMGTWDIFLMLAGKLFFDD